MQKAPQDAKPVAKGPSATMKNLMNMLIGGTAGTIGLCTIYPLECIKTVIQLKSEEGIKTSPLKIFKTQSKQSGLSSFYRGLPAAVARQFFFASIRLGLYFNIADYIKKKNNKASLGLFESTAASLVSAAIGISSVMPFDVVFVRFQAENALAPDQRRGYTGLGNALSRICKEEGTSTLWRGIIPAIGRGMALNFGMLVPYDKCKALLSPYLGYTRSNYLLSAAIAGFGASFCCLPFDNAKVKLQKMKPGVDGKLPYKGLMDCFMKCVKKEGVTGLWSGFLTFYAVIGPHSMLSILISDALRIVFGISKT